jgi:hypothetical protein
MCVLLIFSIGAMLPIVPLGMEQRTFVALLEMQDGFRVPRLDADFIA